MPSHFKRLDPPKPSTGDDPHAVFFEQHVDRSGTFFNPWGSKEPPPTRDLLKWQLSKNPYRAEKKLETPMEPDRDGIDAFKNSTADVRVLWMGHASFLVGIEETTVLFDPVYGKLGPFISRWAPEPFPLGELPPIDAVFLSHGHYDHLDAATLRTVCRSNTDAVVFAPLGQDAYLPRECANIEVFDWWNRAGWRGLELTFLPMQHWHRRGLTDYNKALWGAWRVGERVFHCGDSGYCDVFSLLGKRWEFDIAMMPVGAFEPRWFMKEQHMNPEESLQAFDEMGAERFVAMHWGTYDLTDEPRKLGAERVVALAAEQGCSPQVYVPPAGGLLEF